LEWYSCDDVRDDFSLEYFNIERDKKYTIPFVKEALSRQKINEPALRKIFDELEFRQLSARIFGEIKSAPVVAVPKNQPVQTSLFDIPTGETVNEDFFTNQESIKTTQHRYSLLDTESDIADFIGKIKSRKFVVFDTETTSIDPLTAELVGMSFALQEGEAFFVSIPSNREEAVKKAGFFKEILESPDILKIGQNIKFDINVMKKYGIRVGGAIFDTLVAHYLLNPEYHHNLDYLAETYLNYRTIHIEELIGARGKNQLNMRQVALNALVDYACEDADITLRLKSVFEEKIAKNNFAELLYDIEFPLVNVLADMEEAGVRLDTSALKQSSIGLTQYLLEVEQTVFEMAGIEFNISSPKMVGEVLFDRLKIVEKSKKTKSGQYSTGEDVLENLKSKHPVVEKILEYRKIKKLLTTYIDALPTLISPLDGKVHTTYNQAITATGRLSSTNPNLQNIPIRDEEGKEIRKAFIPDEGCLFLSADYSQIELRIMAHLSEDKNMIDAFLSGKDIHASTAAQIYNIPIEQVTRDMRRKAKTANFGIIYGISVFGLSEQLRIPRSEAKELIDGYFITYPGVRDYMEKSIEIARQNGYVETIFRRKRFLPDINSRNTVVRGYAERNAINAPIQGSAADIIKVAMNRIHRRFQEEKLRSRMIMQVHDELNFNVFPYELEKVKEIVVYEMENATRLKVPVIADCGVGNNWLEAH
jgi:DNA polymerase-1